jgi:hypothetical protein
MSDAKDFILKATNFHQNIVDDIPQMKRGKVWCIICGHVEQVDSAQCLASGWPECCGYTMTIDSPEERKEFEDDEL